MKLCPKAEKAIVNLPETSKSKMRIDDCWLLKAELWMFLECRITKLGIWWIIEIQGTQGDFFEEILYNKRIKLEIEKSSKFHNNFL